MTPSLVTVAAIMAAADMRAKDNHVAPPPPLAGEGGEGEATSTEQAASPSPALPRKRGGEGAGAVLKPREDVPPRPLHTPGSPGPTSPHSPPPRRCSAETPSGRRRGRARCARRRRAG